MTNEEIIQRGILIRDETEPAQNTSERVGSGIEGIGRNLADKDAAIAAEAARNGYYQCTVNNNQLAVTAPGFTLPAHGGNIRIKMSAPATGACTLNINSTGPKALLYNGAALSSANTWEKDEIISVFYDGTKYIASNSQGGGGNASMIKYDNSQSGLAAGNVQGALNDAVLCIDLINSDSKINYNINVATDATYNGEYNISAEGKWVAAQNGIYFLPIKKGYENIYITAKSGYAAYYSVLTSDKIVEGAAVPFATGYTEYKTISPNIIEEIVIPEDGRFVLILGRRYFQNPNRWQDILPSSIIATTFNAKYEIEQLKEKNYVEIDIDSLEVVDSTIASDGDWYPTGPNLGGRSIIINCQSYDTDVIVTTTGSSNVLSFLKQIPSSFSIRTTAVFADGETGRRPLYEGVNTLSIPATTRYIAINCETSSGVDVSPESISIQQDNSMQSVMEAARELISLKGQVTEKGTIYLENMINVTPVSDPLKALASGECNAYHEVSTGLVYFTAIEGFDHAYEAYDCVSLYVFSLTNPNNVKRFEIAKATDKGVQRCYTPNLVPISAKNVRVFYTFQNESNADGAYLYYKDFSFDTETFGEENKVKLSDTTDLTAKKIRDYAIEKEGANQGMNYVYVQKITDVASDGYRYCTLNSGESINYNIVVARSNDNFSTIEMVDITPFRIRYDCAIGVISSKLYFVYRIAGNEYASSSGTSLCTAEISNGTITNWSTPVKFAEGDSRPDCYVYDSKMYMMAGNLHSVKNKPMRISSSVWEGISSDPSEYKKVLVVEDSRGVQNPRVFRYGCGDYGVLMQNSPARVDYANGWQGQWQFKTAVCYVCTRIN